MSVGRVYLVGAGPGDPDLLTLRAFALLRAAEVVAYDELISPEILALIPERCTRLSVGRRHGTGATSYRLHPDVLSAAQAGKQVVRLKAGDPMIFGRGGEEAEELAQAGIPFEIVPGVSAALGASAYAGIPLTHRDHAGHVLFATGHHADHNPPGWATRPGTVVLYMAVRRLALNLKRLIDDGRSPGTPAALVAEATTPRQRVVTGTLETLSERAAEIPESAPALVIAGEVVSLRERLAWFERLRGEERQRPRGSEERA